MSGAQVGRRAGRVMLILAWGAALLLATHFFGAWEDRRANPNRDPQSVHRDGLVEVRLLANQAGHYLLDGRIDEQPVTFLVDTGASAVAVPAGLAEWLRLQPGAAVEIRTANGTATAWRTRLARLQLGDIELRDVPALITPGMEGDEVLLGMSALKRLELVQRDGSLLLRQVTPHD